MKTSSCDEDLKIRRNYCWGTSVADEYLQWRRYLYMRWKKIATTFIFIVNCSNYCLNYENCSPQLCNYRYLGISQYLCQISPFFIPVISTIHKLCVFLAFSPLFPAFLISKNYKYYTFFYYHLQLLCKFIIFASTHTIV